MWATIILRRSFRNHRIVIMIINKARHDDHTHATHLSTKNIRKSQTLAKTALLTFFRTYGFLKRTKKSICWKMGGNLYSKKSLVFICGIILFYILIGIYESHIHAHTHIIILQGHYVSYKLMCCCCSCC